MKTGESLLSIGKFIAEYSAHLMGAGVHTSRVVRNTKRIGEAFGLDVKLSVFHRNIILTIIDKETNEACNEVIDIPAHPISFEHNSELSALSWEAVDNHLSLEELKDKYKKIISAPRIHSLFVLLLVGFANASFCKLFGGDLISMGIVFSATITGFYLKQQMQAKKDQSLCCIHCFGFCCFPVCFYRTDFRYNFGDCHGNQRALSCAWGSLD